MSNAAVAVEVGGKDSWRPPSEVKKASASAPRSANITVLSASTSPASSRTWIPDTLAPGVERDDPLQPSVAFDRQGIVLGGDVGEGEGSGGGEGVGAQERGTTVVGSEGEGEGSGRS